MKDLRPTKEEIEELIGYEIRDFKVESVYDEKNYVGLSVQIIPLSFSQFIKTEIGIKPTTQANKDCCN